MSTIDEGRNSAVECSPWDGGAGKLPPGLEGGCWAGGEKKGVDWSED